MEAYNTTRNNVKGKIWHSISPWKESHFNRPHNWIIPRLDCTSKSSQYEIKLFLIANKTQKNDLIIIIFDNWSDKIFSDQKNNKFYYKKETTDGQIIHRTLNFIIIYGQQKNSRHFHLYQFSRAILFGLTKSILNVLIDGGRS